MRGAVCGGDFDGRGTIDRRQSPRASLGGACCPASESVETRARRSPPLSPEIRPRKDDGSQARRTKIAQMRPGEVLKGQVCTRDRSVKSGVLQNP